MAGEGVSGVMEKLVQLVQLGGVELGGMVYGGAK